MSLLWFYKKGMTLGEPAIRLLLNHRARIGKEDPARLKERFGISALPRPNAPLIWVHVASVGEAQSMLSLVDIILSQQPTAHVLITSITTTSARLLEQRLPDRAFHQYVPVDHPDWVRRFLDHWRPDLVLWAESELWPNTLTLLKKRNVPVALLNAHMSEKSFKNWSKAPRLAEDMLSAFMIILTQTAQDADYYTRLGARSLVITDNIKYSAAPLPYDQTDYDTLKSALGDRPVWLYASTHAGEEALACEVHKSLTARYPNLLTIIVPRHPARTSEIESVIGSHDLTYQTRGTSKALPTPADQIYIVDTLGELGLFYRASPLACIGRSFSDDGGGGHNPIEAAMLKCAILHGPNVQNLARIFAEMNKAGAAMLVSTREHLAGDVEHLLKTPERLKELQDSGYAFASRKAEIMATIIQELEPAFILANLPVLKAAP
jgi:3-deoxy-D-manno-octulosonic-acid transferase